MAANKWFKTVKAFEYNNSDGVQTENRTVKPNDSEATPYVLGYMESSGYECLSVDFEAGTMTFTKPVSDE